MIPFHKVLAKVPFEVLEILDGQCARFTFSRPRMVPRHWRMVLQAEVDVESLSPEAPDPEAVAEQFERVHLALIESFEAGAQSELFAQCGVQTPEQWLEVLLDHYCRPRWAYTNGQRLFTLVERPGSLYEVAHLPSLSALEEFRTLHVGPLPTPHEVQCFGHLDAAEAYILRELSLVGFRVLPLRRGARRRMLLLQPAGKRPGSCGQVISIYMAYVDGMPLVLEIEPETRDAYTVLNELSSQLGGDVVEACATCASFRFSGKIRSSSGGRRGYCRRRLDAVRATGLPMPGLDLQPSFGTLVSVFDRCLSYEAIDDEDREVQFCQRGASEWE